MSCVRIQRGNWGSGPPLENYKIIGFLINTCPDPLKSQSYQSSIQCCTIIGPPAKRHWNCVSLARRWWPANSGILIFPPLIKLKKNLFKLDPLWQNFLDPRMHAMVVCTLISNTKCTGERSGSVVECLTRDRTAAGSSLTGVTALCPWARKLILA